SAEYRSQAGDYLRTGESAAESKGGKFARRDGCGKAARRKSPKEGLSPLAWKSRKRRGIPTFPQPLRRLPRYIFNASIAVLRVTSLNVLTRPGLAFCETVENLYSERRNTGFPHPRTKHIRGKPTMKCLSMKSLRFLPTLLLASSLAGQVPPDQQST